MPATIKPATIRTPRQSALILIAARFSPRSSRHSELHGTFFVTMDNIRHRLPEWEAIVPHGHELADHTIDHPCDLQRFTPEEFAARELTPMETWLDRVEPGRQTPSYAYPCDVTDLGDGSANRQARRYDRLLAEHGIVAARTSEGGPNRSSVVLKRPYRLQALAVGYDALSFEAVDAYLRFAVRHGRWAILIFHGITTGMPKPGEVTADMHARVLDRVLQLPLWCAPLGQVFEQVRGDRKQSAPAILPSTLRRS